MYAGPTVPDTVTYITSGLRCHLYVIRDDAGIGCDVHDGRGAGLARARGCVAVLS